MEAKNFPTRMSFPQPFASGANAMLTPISDVTGSDVNYVDGFPSQYGTPVANGGKFVTRGEMNAIGNLASRNDFYYHCGGLNTFDPEFCLKIGGYAAGAVLDYVVSGVLIKVVSLRDNNFTDFRGLSTIPGIASGSIDGYWWRRITQEEPEIVDKKTIVDFNVYSPQYFTLCGVFTATKNEFINARLEDVATGTGGGYLSNQFPCLGNSVCFFSEAPGAMDSACILIKDVTDESSLMNIQGPSRGNNGDEIDVGNWNNKNWNNWKVLTGSIYFIGFPVWTSYTINALASDATLDPCPRFNSPLQIGHKYAIGLTNYPVTSSSLIVQRFIITSASSSGEAKNARAICKGSLPTVNSARIVVSYM